ncbi:MAG: hypothetical protein HY722_03915 [Planctomycetes bacterium]|nr:hypothetical protein [Planctomycetota bacterium]
MDQSDPVVRASMDLCNLMRQFMAGSTEAAAILRRVRRLGTTVQFDLVTSYSDGMLDLELGRVDSAFEGEPRTLEEEFPGRPRPAESRPYDAGDLAFLEALGISPE